MEGRYDICERNTFLDFPAPKPLPLEKAQTDPPPGLERLWHSKFVSETEHSEDSTAADETDEAAPPPLPLEVFVTPDCFEDELKPFGTFAPVSLSAEAPAFEPRRTQISLEEMLPVPELMAMPPRWLPAPPMMPAPMIAEPPAPEVFRFMRTHSLGQVPMAVAVAGPALPERDLPPGHLLCKAWSIRSVRHSNRASQALGDRSWDVGRLIPVDCAFLEVHWSLDSRQCLAQMTQVFDP